VPSASASTPSVLAAALAALVVVSTGATAAQGGSSRVEVQPTQTLAILLGSHAAMSAPEESSTALELVRAKRPITEERTVLPVIGHTSGPDGGGWLQVLLPGRPNGHTGWIKLRATRAARTSWHIVVDTTTRRVTIYYKGRSVRVFKAVVGKPATPTPRGEFFVEEVIQLRAGDVGAPYALALSARSNVLQEFAGGPGQIALHGLRNVGGVLGSAVSHGCVRLANAAMRWLNVRIGPGTPVTIR
jgi:lipoprotein-anchoring transpeptidase ErfK/SrfK